MILNWKNRAVRDAVNSTKSGTFLLPIYLYWTPHISRMCLSM